MKSNRINKNIIEIIDDSGVRMFLVEGENQAVLIDTGAGFKCLKDFVDSLTKKPYFVILTHGHVDHASGSALFDKVYLNENDFELKKIHCTLENKFDYANRRAGINDKSLFIQEKEQSFLRLLDGQIFDLGGITLKCISAPGHTKGMMCILIKELRTLILGDACNNFSFMFLPECTNLSTLKASLKKLLLYKNDFDYIYSSHGELVQNNDIIQGCIQVIDDIFEGKDDKIPCKIMGIDCYIAKEMIPNSIERKDHGQGNIVYSLNSVK